jgi:hypothetical protein
VVVFIIFIVTIDSVALAEDVAEDVADAVAVAVAVAGVCGHDGWWWWCGTVAV